MGRIQKQMSSLWVVWPFLVQATPVADRFVALTRQIRCPVCAGQSLADSEAPVAQALARHIEEAIRQGASDKEILEAFAAHYGDEALLLPPCRGRTWLLWATPFLIFIGGMLAALRWWRRRLA